MEPKHDLDGSPDVLTARVDDWSDCKWGVCEGFGWVGFLVQAGSKRRRCISRLKSTPFFQSGRHFLRTSAITGDHS